jgi:hypothetical protein
MRAALVALCVGLFALAGQAHARSANHPDRRVVQVDSRGLELRLVSDGGADRRGGAVHRPLDQEVEGIHQMISASRRTVGDAREGVTNARERLSDLRSQALAAAERARTMRAQAQPDSRPPREQEIRDPEEGPADRPADPEPPGPSEGNQTMGTEAPNSAQSRHCHAPPLADWFGPSPVECGRKNTDRYGSMVAVGLRMTVELGAWMVRAGWALAYRTYSSHDLPREASAHVPEHSQWAGESLRLSH